MDASAIKEIQLSQATARSQQGLTDALVAERGAFMAHADFKLIDIEHLLPAPIRHRFKFATDSIDDYIGYLVEEATSNSLLLLRPDLMTAHCRLVHGTDREPQHCTHTATYNPIKTAAYEAMLKACERSPCSQSAVAEFIEDWADHIECYNSSQEPMTVGQAVSKIRAMKIDATAERGSTDGDFEQSLSESEKIELRAANEFPAVLTFACTPYTGFKERTFTIRLSIITDARRPAISLRVVRHDLAVEEMGEEMRQKIDLGLNEANIDLPIFIGREA